jgi:primary-amine oxidase
MNPEPVSRIASTTKALQSPKHPLDPLTAAEIIQVSSLLKSQEPGKKHGLHFKAIGIIEPPKRELRAFLSAERKGLNPTLLPRRASALFYHRGTSDIFLAEVDLGVNRVDKIEQLESRVHAQADIDEAVMMRDLCLQHPKILEAIRKFKIPENLTVVCDTWPYGRDHGEECPRLVQARCTNIAICYIY